MGRPRPEAGAGPREPLPSIEVRVVRVPGRRRGRIASPLDGRHGALEPTVVQAYARRLATLIDVQHATTLVALPEGGSVPGYALALETGLPLVLASAMDHGYEAIDFEEEHAPAWRRTKRIFGLHPGDRVILVEDEVTTGLTARNCILAMRRHGVRCDEVAAFLAIDHPGTLATLENEGVRLLAARWLPAALLDELLDPP